MTDSLPPEVAAAWGWRHAEVRPLEGGLINKTFEVQLDGMAIAVLQRLHPIFGREVNLDIEAVTKHLIKRGLSTPWLVRTLSGEAWFEHADPATGVRHVWRALTYIAGVSVPAIPDPSWADAAGELVGRFHRALSDFQHDYAFARAGVHDTAAHLVRLDKQLLGSTDVEAVDLGREILDAAKVLPVLEPTPVRHCHGDLKVSNVRFTIVPSIPGQPPKPPYGNCLVDLDTVGLGTIAFELGDALRSWCNPSGEDAGSVRFDLGIFEAAIRGYRRVADKIVSDAERRSVIVGLETVCIELAARFAVDVFRDEYFGWDATRFPSRRAHNLVRARGQLALGRAVRAERVNALDILIRNR